VNPSFNSKRLDFSPGLSSSQERRSIRILELNVQDRPNSNAGADPTTRDLAILQELDSHRYLDRNQIQALFFPGPRSCQYRLRCLLDQGLVRTWRAATRPGRICRGSVYLLSRRGAALLAEWRDDDPRPYLKRAEHALERHFHLIHQLEANQFFVGLAAAIRAHPDLGLYHWVGEHEIAASYAEAEEHGPNPDGWGRLLTPDGEVLLHLEWDRGTEQPRRLRLKLEAYRAYFVARPQASCNQVLLAAPGDRRARLIRDVVKAVGALATESAADFGPRPPHGFAPPDRSEPFGGVRIALKRLPSLPCLAWHALPAGSRTRSPSRRGGNGGRAEDQEREPAAGGGRSPAPDGN